MKVLSEESIIRIKEAAAKGNETQKQAAAERRANFIKLCPCCQSQMTYEQRNNKYCSKSCAATINNQGVNRHPERTKNSICKHCQKTFTNKSQIVFCSQKCSNDWKWAQTKAKILKDQRYPNINYNSIRVWARKLITELRGWKCEICQRTEWEGQAIPLVVDHADGDPTNQHIDNIRLVCGNCNMQLPTFAGKNRGKGRTQRKENDRKLAQRFKAGFA